MTMPAVRQALETQLATVSPPILTAYENTPFTPVIGTAYQRVWLLTGAPDNLEMGRTAQERGFLQVTLCYPLNTGSGAALARAELVRAAFRRGQSLTANGVITIIEKTPEIGPAGAEDDYYTLPIRIRFFSNFNS